MNLIRLFILQTLLSFTATCASMAAEQANPPQNPRTIYLSFILHGNMNYDRYPASTIREKFPETYQNVLDFIEARPEFKGQMQLSGQTFKTLQQIHPDFLLQTQRLAEAGQIDVTGTFYSEPVNVSMDGETNLLTASLGTRIANEELAPSSGYFLQEYAWHPQLPWVLTEAGVDWVPIRPHQYLSHFPVLAVGLDGTRIPAVIKPARNNKESIAALVENAPDNALFIIGDDYEYPPKFIQNYEYFWQYDKEHPEVNIEWILVRDYLERFPPKNELMVTHADLAGIENWDSYSRWTADPLDIEVHTWTKRAMAALRAAKIARTGSIELARSLSLNSWKEPDVKVNAIESVGSDSWIPWDIEQAEDYPSVEPGYLQREGEVTLLSRAEHLLAWAVNSDSRGWWPLFERRLERIESLQEVIHLSNELIERSLSQTAGANAKLPGSRSVLLFNAEKERESVVVIDSRIPHKVVDADGAVLPSRVYRNGSQYRIESKVTLPDYGFKVLTLKPGATTHQPIWEPGDSISDGDLELEAKEDAVVLTAGERSFRIAPDPFQVRVLAELLFVDRDLSMWKDAEPYGPTRISVSTSGLYPKLRVDRQLDWTVHLRQEYELRDGQLECSWTFFMPQPTILRKVGDIGDLGREALFKPEGLMARIESGSPGKAYYDIPFGVVDHNHPDPSYVTALNFALLQQANAGFMVVAKTGTQAIEVNQKTGSLTLALGASTGSGPVRNPEMKVTDVDVSHERPFYQEPFQGSYHHEFAILPYDGQWEAFNAPRAARAYANEVYQFDLLPSTDAAALPQEASLMQISDPTVEITMADTHTGAQNSWVRVNERTGRKVQGEVNVGMKSVHYDLQPFAIQKRMLRSTEE